MSDVKPIQSQKHHWWPQSVSRLWRNDAGIVHQLFYDGRTAQQTSTDKFGGMRNGHTIKLSKVPTVWDQNFENYFSRADEQFRYLLGWLDNAVRTSDAAQNLDYRELRPIEIDQRQFNMFFDCLLSLVVRSPRFRNQIRLAINGAYDLDNLDEEHAHKALINLNLRDAYTSFQDTESGRGKFILLWSQDREFVFGDGFYHNYKSPSGAPIRPKILVPLLPNLCAYYEKPASYPTEPRMVVSKVDHDAVDQINQIMMVYSKDYVFYRDQKPQIISDFEAHQFLEFEHDDHPLICELSSVCTGCID